MLAVTTTTTIALAHGNTEMLDLWLFGKSKNTQDAYRRDLNSFMAFTEGKSLSSVTINDLQSFAKALEVNGLKQSSINRKLLSVKSCLTYLKKLGLSQINAGAAVAIAPARDTISDRILSEADVLQMIYSAADPIEKLILKVLYATGLRVSELISLRWDDLTPRGNVAQITIFGKGGKTRNVLIKSALYEEIQGLPRLGETILATKTGKPYDRPRIHRLIKEAGDRVGLPKVSAHWFRHANASHSLDRGCPIHVVQASLGHSSLTTTQRYLHSRPDDSSGLHLPI